MSPTQQFAYFNKAGRLPETGVKSYALFEGDRQISEVLPYAVLQTLKKNKIKSGCKAHYLKIKPVKL